MIKAKEGCLYPESDMNFKNLQNARMTMIDMTEYEYNFPGPNEVGNIPMLNQQLLKPHK